MCGARIINHGFMERTNPLKSLFAVALHFSSYANMNMSKAQNLFAVFNESCLWAESIRCSFRFVENVVKVIGMRSMPWFSSTRLLLGANWTSEQNNTIGTTLRIEKRILFPVMRHIKEWIGWMAGCSWMGKDMRSEDTFAVREREIERPGSRLVGHSIQFRLSD